MSQHRPHTPWKKVVGLAVVLTVAMSVLVLAFSWSSVTSSAKDIPVAIVGSSAQIEAVTTALTADDSNTFDVSTADSRADAVASIESRDILGAIVLGDDAEVLSTSAGSPIVSQILATVATQLEAQANAAAQAALGDAAPAITVALTDVVPLADTDPRGAGLSVAAFPLVVAGLLGGILFSLIVAGTRQRLVGVVAYALVSGFAIAAIMQPVLGILQGVFVVNALAIALSTLGSAAFVLGLHSLLGQRGIPIGAITLMLIANPISSAAQPMQFLVGPWGAIGQWFVPGASASLLRDLSYFPNAESLGFSWAVVSVWALAGIALTIVGGNFRKTHVVVDATPAGLEPVAP
jgi:hypothetical protein